MEYIKRRETKEINIGGTKIGGGNPVLIQSMCNTDTRDVPATIAQINALEKAGCEIIRAAVPDMEAAEALSEIKRGINIPLVADIHFDYRLALKAMESGADKIRINPGNIGGAQKVRAVADAARARGIPIRVGVNSGSIEKPLLLKYGVTAEALAESALTHISMLEGFGFYDIVVSVKTSDVPMTIKCFETLSERMPYPLHIGVTEAGTTYGGTIKSAVGIGALLAMGIGDTLRVSLTGDPLEEVRAAREILKSLGLRRFGPTLVSCPTCGRTNIDIIAIAQAVERELCEIDKPIKVAVMGCEVNGPGEAGDADIGVAGGRGFGLLFRNGKIIMRVPEEEIVSALIDEIKKF